MESGIVGKSLMKNEKWKCRENGKAKCATLNERKKNYFATKHSFINKPEKLTKDNRKQA